MEELEELERKKEEMRNSNRPMIRLRQMLVQTLQLIIIKHLQFVWKEKDIQSNKRMLITTILKDVVVM